MGQAAILDHQFRVAAYVVTWAIQLGYLAWLGLKWRAQKREAARLGSESRQSRRGSRRNRLKRDLEPGHKLSGSRSVPYPYSPSSKRPCTSANSTAQGRHEISVS